MGDQTPKQGDVRIFFFPFVGGGHMIPMVDMARVFASHGAVTVIVATPNQSLPFRDSIASAQSLQNLPISIHTLQVPNDLPIKDAVVTALPITDTSMLQDPLKRLLLDQKPHCIVHDVFHRWAAEAIDSTGTLRIAFSGNGCFPKLVEDKMFQFKPQDSVDSENEPFVIPELPHIIELTKSQLPTFNRPRDIMATPGEKTLGVLVNSFYELESSYADQLIREFGKKYWVVGPVSLFHREKSGRGKQSSIDESRLLSWLDQKPPNSVLYISFGSLVRMATWQLEEIADALESSGCQFIWVVPEGDLVWLPEGYEERMKERCLIIRGWAPQLVILEHGSVGGFMTHCGWNSTLEGVAAGVPMITWPYSGDQFVNEKLIVDVLRIGIKVGSMHWNTWQPNPKSMVGREKVKEVVVRWMSGGEEVEAMRRRVQLLKEKARRAVEPGGSSYNDVDALIQEIQRRCRPTTSVM